MALLIKGNCELCDACVLECPNEAIEEGDPYIIDALRCTECVGERAEPGFPGKQGRIANEIRDAPWLR